MHLRQIALVAKDLDSTLDTLRAVFDLPEPFADPGVGTFGLVNGVFPVGNTFLEVVSPAEADTTAGRFLQRRKGDGGYMVIVQSDDLDADRTRLEGLGVRIVWELALEDIATLHLHPRDVGGAILSIDASDPPATWRWAGPGWEAKPRGAHCLGIVGARIQSDDPAARAARWAEVLDTSAPSAAGDAHRIDLDGSYIDFVPSADERGEGLRGLAIQVRDPSAVLEAAQSRGLKTGPDRVEIAGVEITLC